MDEAIELVDLPAQRRRLRDDLDRAIATVLEHGRFIMGPEVAQLEAALGELTGAVHVISCSSGTDALQLAAMAKNVGPGDAVIVPAFTFPATPEVVVLLGATPVFADVDQSSFNLDPTSADEAVLRARQAGLRPVGVIAVDLYGAPASYAELRELAAHYQLWLLADAAQSVGGTYRGAQVGTLGDITAASFFPAKPLGCYGDGGAVFTDDDGLAVVMRSLRSHGAGASKYDIERVGINGRLDTLQAAILLIKLQVFEDEIQARRRIAEQYRAGLEGVVTTPDVEEGATSAWAQYTVQLEGRDRVAAALAAQGIPTAVYYPRPLHHQPPYSAAPRTQSLAVSERLAESVLSLPMHPYLTESAQTRVIDALLAEVGAWASLADG